MGDSIFGEKTEGKMSTLEMEMEMEEEPLSGKGDPGSVSVASPRKIFCCCSPNVPLMFLALISILASLILIGASSWIFKETHRTQNDLLFKWGVPEGKDGIFLDEVQNPLDKDKELDILLATSGLGIGVGVLQLLSSILLVAGACGKLRHHLGAFTFINMLGILAIVSSLICIFHNKVLELKGVEEVYKELNLEVAKNFNIHWITVMVGDGVFLLIAVGIVIKIMRL